jgi:predicted outer membrane repeat protein
MSDHLWLARRLGCATPRRARPRTRRRLYLEVLEGRLAPATLTVNSIADTASDSDPYLSLREAIAIVNSPSLPTDLTPQILGQISGTLHSGGADTIGFDPAGVTGPIVLGGTQLELSLPSGTAAVTIDGSAASVTVDGNHASRALYVDPGAQLTLTHLTITHGQGDNANPGGGIDNGGTLTVTSSTLSANTVTTSSGQCHGGGIYNTGTLTVTSSTLSANTGNDPGLNSYGAGIFNDTGGTLTVTSSTFSANSATGSGGGIYSSTGTTLTVTSSTFSANASFGSCFENFGTGTVTSSTFSANFGPAIANAVSGTLTVTGSTLSANTVTGPEQGGGIENSGTLMVTNSTLSANSASSGGAIYNFQGTLTLTNSTLSANSAGNAAGGIGVAGGVVDLRNTIVAGNVAPSGADIRGPVSSTSGYNLIGDGTGLSGISNGLGGNLIGTAASPIDPRLGPLADNGGPTRTQAVLADSPARGAGSLAYATATDQRGLPRTVAGEIDLGAYQTQTGVAGPRAVVSDPAWVVDPPVDHVRLTFNHPLDPASVTTGAFSLTGPSGAVPVTGVTAVGSSDDQQFDVGFPAQAAPGGYALAVGTGIQDTHGVALAGPYTARFTVFGTGSTLTVNSTADTASDSDPYLSLREAIAIVNSPTVPADLSPQILAQISGNLHANGSDVIAFDPAAVTGPIVLAGTQLEVSLSGSKARVTIDGGAGVTVDGNHASRVLQLDAGAQLTLAHLTITHGQAPGGNGGGINNNGGTLTVSGSTVSANSASSGGGIYNSSGGTVTVSSSTVSVNSASPGGISTTLGGGIANDGGTLTVSNSTVSANSASGILSPYGGGISSTGPLTVTDSIISSNSAALGGGIYSTRTLTVSNSRFLSNTAFGSLVGSGGGIYNFGTGTVTGSAFTSNQSFQGGGAIANGNDVGLTVRSSTFNNNSSRFGGAIENFGMLTVVGSTLTANRTTSQVGGGLINSGTVHLQDTIVAGNVATSGPDISGSVEATSGYNLVGNGSGMTGISDGVNHNQVGTAASPIDPQLAPLGYYGGPTQTYPLLPGSPALGTGDPTITGTDQRGQPLPGAGNDIGAFQSQANPFLVTTLTDPGQLTGLLSLREALTLAGTLTGSNTVSFDPSLASGTITLTAGELLLGHSVTITGPTGGLTVSGNSASRVFEVAAGVTASLSGLTIANGLVSSSSSARGGGILNAGSLSLTDCTISNNQVTVSLTGTGTEDVLVQGGGIASTGNLTLLGCTVSGNSATLSAGNLDYGQANGGGLYANGAMVTLTNSTVAGNSSTSTFTGGNGLVYAYGGGLTSDTGTLTLSGCTISGNTATGDNGDGNGGGLHAYQSTVSLTNCTIANNTAGSASGTGYGGGLSDLGSTFTLISCTISGNTAASSGSGGGIYFDGSAGSVQVSNTIVAGNNAAGAGPDASGSFSSLGYNLIGITDGSSGWGGTDLTGTASSPLDPGLGPLADNGGPTQTMALLDGSAARGAGDPGLLGTADQRGVLRTGAVDIGAFQATSG